MFLVATNRSKINAQNKTIKKNLFIFLYKKLFKYLFCKTVSFCLARGALLIISNVKSLTSELGAQLVKVKW